MKWADETGYISSATKSKMEWMYLLQHFHIVVFSSLTFLIDDPEVVEPLYPCIYAYIHLSITRLENSRLIQ